VLWWDIRKLGEPTESLELLSGESTSGGVCLEYSAAGGPTKFMVGTEQGSILMCNRKGKSAADKVGTVYSGHHGPTYALQRNPFFPKYFLSIGDWRHMLWSEDLRTPIMTSAYHSAYLLSACWSPTRPAVFFSSKMDGTLDVWDFFYKVNEPTLTLQVDGDGLQCVRVQEGGSILATGSVDGSVYLMELCESLAVQQPQEKQSMQQMLDREFKKEKNLEARTKELAKKAAKEHEAAKDPTALQPTDEALKAVEQEFYDTIAEYEQKELEASRKD
jgi:dynein intermediate chain 2